MQIFKTTLIAATVFSFAACSEQFRNHGYAPTDGDLAEVAVGVDTRDSVIERFGPPTTGGMRTDSGIYYVESQFRLYAYQAPSEVDREVVAISTDSDGVVSNIERFTLEDGQVVALSRRVTDSNIEGVSFLRQLLGNLGNVDAESLLDDA
jgi:outer membrane protein assembly factor BamE (lipoprotein component of BamABCDE complex)